MIWEIRWLVSSTWWTVVNYSLSSLCFSYFFFFLPAIYSSTCTALIRAQARARPWKMCSRCELECRKGLWRKRIGTPQGCTGETRVSENSRQDRGGFDRTKWRGASHWVQWDTITPRFRMEMMLYAVCMEFHRSPHFKKMSSLCYQISCLNRCEYSLVMPNLFIMYPSMLFGLLVYFGWMM